MVHNRRDASPRYVLPGRLLYLPSLRTHVIAGESVEAFATALYAFAFASDPWCGAVTIAGTDSTIQLSFFLVACDYTLIGEELFAAAGLVSGSDTIMAGVWAQDWLKYLILALLLSGVLLGALTDFNLAGFLVP